MKFAVSVPVTMHISILVEAADEESAKAAAFQTEYGLEVVGKDSEMVEIIEWETHTCVNVYSGVINEIEVESVD